MRKSLLLIFFAMNALAGENLQERWLTTFKISELHPEYKLSEEIKNPAGTWQLIARIHSLESLGKKNRSDCLFVKVPQNNEGEIKVVSTIENQSCLEARENDSIYRVQNLKTINIDIREENAKFTFTDESGRVQQENYKFLNIPKTSKFELHSHPESREVIYFQPNSVQRKNVEGKLIGELNDRYPSHPCDFESGSCQRCRFGVYRLNTNEYFCGIDQCGEKNNPACLRGSKWQHSREEYSCRGVNTHVFCRPGLKVECEGERAICR